MLHRSPIKCYENLPAGAAQIQAEKRMVRHTEGYESNTLFSRLCGRA
jgi:hypothetical protein